MSGPTDVDGGPGVILVEDDDFEEEEEEDKSTSIEEVDDDNVIEDDDDDDEDDEDEGDDDGADDDNDDYESTDYCTDGSSTISSSSSATNNQPDNTRVCDCCYCEVFGHGVTPVAPTSRNFQEMRERLRKRLSKRREERCQRSQCSAPSTTANANASADANPNAITTASQTDGIGGGGDDAGGGEGEASSQVKDKKGQKQKKSEGQMGDSSIEEILKYINGSPKEGTSSNSKKKKDNKKNSSSSSRKSKIKSTNNTIASKDSKDPDKCLQQSTASNSQSKVNYNSLTPTKALNNTSNSAALDQSSIHQSGRSSKSCPESNLRYNNSQVSQTTFAGCEHVHTSSSNSEKPQRHKRKDREKSAQKTMSKKSQQNNIPQQTKAISPASSNASSRDSSKSSLSTTSDKILSCPSRRSLLSGKIGSSQDEHHQTLSIDDCDTSNNISCQSQDGVSDQEHQESIDRLVGSVSDDVFEPRDIDLEDDQLDEFERELEAFKRFCLDSISLVKKERLQIKLKDTECFKEFDQRFANTSKILNNRSDQQSPGKRKGGQYYSRDLQKFTLIPQNG